MRFHAAPACGRVASLMLLAATAAAAEPPPTVPWVIASAGTFALVEEFDYPYRLGLQYRSTPRTAWALAPGIGVAAGPDGMGYFYADVAHDFHLPRQWSMTLSLAAGYFLNGDAIGANEQLEFQSGLELTRALKNGMRIGLAGYHVSNGGLAHPNNGSEALVLLLGIPVRSSR